MIDNDDDFREFAEQGGVFLSAADMAELYGGRIPPKLEMLSLGERLFRREVDGSWWEYRRAA